MMPSVAGQAIPISKHQKPSGVLLPRPLFIDKDAVPQFQYDECHYLFEIDKFACLHFFEQSFYIGGIEVPALANLSFVESLSDQAADLRVLEEEFHRKKERIFPSLCHFARQQFRRDLPLDDFVPKPIVFQTRWDAE